MIKTPQTSSRARYGGYLLGAVVFIALAVAAARFASATLPFVIVTAVG